MKKQSIWVFQWRKSVHYWWSYILFSPECKELTSMLDPLLYRWGVPPVVIRCVHWTMQMWVLQTWIKALGLYIVMNCERDSNSWFCRARKNFVRARKILKLHARRARADRGLVSSPNLFPCTFTLSYERTCVTPQENSIGADGESLLTAYYPATFGKMTRIT